jgi:hypothetical protein
MKENAMFYIGFCAALPFFFSQVCKVGMIVEFNKKKKMKKKDAHLSSAFMVEVICIILWLGSINGFNKRIPSNAYWFGVWWKIIVCCVICMILSRCLGHFIVWCVKRIKRVNDGELSC